MVEIKYKEFDSEKFGLLISYPKDRNNPKPPQPNLLGYGETRIVETKTSYEVYFRGNGATN